MTGETPAPTAGPKPRRGASETRQGGGSFLKAEHIGPRGREFDVSEVSWQENYAKDALIPCLHLANGEEDDLLFKITNKNNAAALDECGAGGNDETSLAPMVGTKVFLQAIQIRDRSGASKTSIVIGEITKDGKSLWQATPSK
jgi:hypothetical protein